MTRMTRLGRFACAGFLMTACLMMTAATALSQGQPRPAEKKVQIKIVIDGKEIELSDVQVQPDPDRRKPTGDAQPNPARRDGPIHQERKIIIQKGARVIQGVQPQARPDPRIEELVRQAEAIKPGSGAEVRKALQGAARPMGARVIETEGKKVIFLQIEDGKMKLLNEQDLQKLMELGLRLKFDIDVDRKGVAAPKVLIQRAPSATPAPAAAPKVLIRQEPRPAATPAASELDALRRQLERLSNDLQTLRKQLDERKR